MTLPPANRARRNPQAALSSGCSGDMRRQPSTSSSTCKADIVRVLAIGGSASVGKTTCAGTLATKLGAARVVHVDDLSRELQDAGDPHVLDTLVNPWQRSPAYLVGALIAWTERLQVPILACISDLAATGGVIEGEGIDPRLAPALAAAGVATVYVIETDADQLRETFIARPSQDRFLGLTRMEQDTVVEMNRRYGGWLRAAADKAGQPWVPCRPWSTLPDRILDAASP